MKLVSLLPLRQNVRLWRDRRQFHWTVASDVPHHSSTSRYWRLDYDLILFGRVGGLLPEWKFLVVWHPVVWLDLLP